ncbi:hypothetical protein [Nioella sp.]|uniref:hypothetical protein n=1 Tax=Nioella sp. TaxID=1912091 RepID=UPI003A8AEC32
MTTQVTQRGGPDLDIPRLNALAPFASQALFWRAHYISDSPTLEAVPFLFWLCEAARPRIVLTIGVADAVPHFSICQAIDKLGVESMCFGIEPEAIDPLAISEVQKHSQTHYFEISQIMTGDQDAVSRSLGKTRIDFLVVNKIADDALKQSLEQYWFPHLSPTSMIIFMQGGDSVLEFAEALPDHSGSFQLDPASRVFLSLHGSNHDERVSRLCQFDLSTPGYLSIRNVFSRIGELHSNAVTQATLETERETLSAQAAANARELAGLQHRLTSKEEEIKALKERFDEKNAQVAALQADSFDLEQQARRAAEDLAEAQAALTAVEQKTAKLSEENSGISEQKDAAEAALIALKQDYASDAAAHAESLDSERASNAELSGRIEELEGLRAEDAIRLSDVTSKLTDAEKELDACRAELTRAETALQEEHARHDALANSVAETEERLSQSHAQFEKEKADLVAEIQSHANAEASLAESLEVAEEEKRAQLKTIDALKSEVSKLEARLEERDAMQRAAQQTLERETSSRERAQDRFLKERAAFAEIEKTWQIRISRLTSDLEFWRRKEDEYVAELTRANDRRREDQRIIDDLRSQGTSHQEEIQSRLEDLASLSQAIEAERKSRQEAEQDARNLLDQTRQMSIAAQKDAERVAVAEAELEATVARLKDLSAERTVLKTENSRLSKRLETVEDELASSSEEDERRQKADRETIAFLKERLKEAEAQIEQRFVDLSTLGSHLEAERDRRQEEVSSLGNLVKHFEERADSLDRANETMAEELERERLKQEIRDQLRPAGEALNSSLRFPLRARRYRHVQSLLKEELALLESSGLFDKDWYLSAYPDVKDDGIDPIMHFLRYGGFELRDPGPDFSSFDYHAINRDVAENGILGVVHYLRFGKAEGRLTSQKC